MRRSDTAGQSGVRARQVGGTVKSIGSRPGGGRRSTSAIALRHSTQPPRHSRLARADSRKQNNYPQFMGPALQFFAARGTLGNGRLVALERRRTRRGKTNRRVRCGSDIDRE